MFRYEKFRTTYALRSVPGLKIELDETPVGIYLELEGSFAAIDRGASLLGFGRKDYLKDSYGCALRRRLPQAGPETRRHALSGNKKIALTCTLSLTKI